MNVFYVQEILLRFMENARYIEWKRLISWLGKHRHVKMWVRTQKQGRSEWMSAFRAVTVWRLWKSQDTCEFQFSILSVRCLETVQGEFSHSPPSSSWKWILPLSQLEPSFPYVCWDTVYHPLWKGNDDKEPGIRKQTNWIQILTPHPTRCKALGKLVS